jgi:hypothetical protein
MKVEEIAEAVAKLPPNQFARFRRWFTSFETGRTDHAEELETTATKLGRFAARVSPNALRANRSIKIAREGFFIVVLGGF